MSYSLKMVKAIIFLMKIWNNNNIDTSLENL